MRTAAARTILSIILCVLTTTGINLARDLTFEGRVEAQEAIERVYYSHQIGATKPFEEAVPRAVLEGKVRKYLQQTAALEGYWKTRVTDEMLQRELERMAQGTRLPERLRELFAALKGDPFLIQECLARATLVDRLTRNFYAFDPVLHAGARNRAEEIHRRLAAGDMDPWIDHPDRTFVELVERQGDSGGPQALKGGPEEERRPSRPLLSLEEFRKERARWPKEPGNVSPVAEERDAFVIRVVLSDAPGVLRGAAYVLPKRSWDLWWEAVKGGLRDEEVAAAASDEGALPVVGTRLRGLTGAAGTSAGILPDPVAKDSLSSTEDDTWDNGILGDFPERREGHTAVWTGTLMVVWGGFCGDVFYIQVLNTGGRYDPATDSWTPTSTVDAPSGRSGHTAVWTGTRMVVWGGYSYDGVYCFFNTGGRYDPATDSWVPTSTVEAPSPRGLHTAIWTGTRMVVWGGDYDDGVNPPIRFNTGGRYDPATDSWTPTSTVGAPSGRHWHTAVWTGTLMVVWGGYNGSYLNTGGRYDPITDSWTPTSLALPGRWGHTAIWTGTRMVVWGGYAWDYDDYWLNDGGLYDPATDSWIGTSIDGAPAGRALHTAIWTGTHMVVWGGYDDTSLNTGGRYNPLTDTWTPTSTVGAPSRRDLHTAIWTGTLMVVWGGDYDDGVNPPCSLNTGGRYDPATDSWTPTSTMGAPSGGIGQTAVWTGNLMIVWGGWDDAFTNTGGRYDPATDSWTPTSTVGAPSPRYSHTAVWSGSHMVVWGGDYDDGVNPPCPLNTGGRYDPATDTWTPTSTVGAPSGRRLHTAIWSGSHMVVWGGLYHDGASPSYSLNTGGRYDPATDSWAPTSAMGAPSARCLHTAVWTGTRMVVWGGYSYEGVYYFFNTGGRYDPATDSWAPTSTVGAPSARGLHTAIWTGTHMVVWGGLYYDDVYGYVDLNTGGRYDPVTDSWTPTSTMGAPSARDWHTAVWTGTLMVVWGGYGDTYLNTGGRYDPVADSWTPTSTVGAPIPRDLHTAVWTGTFMVIWGGEAGSYLNSGGRYVACADGDGDGYTGCEGDCNDSDDAVYPGAPQICDGLNNDCSDPAWPSLAGTNDYDDDGDTLSECQGDCDDSVAAVYPGAPQICDGLNNDCSDPAWPSLAGTNEYDDDGDTFSECQGDCDDAVAATYPGAIEVNDGLDNQCDGDVGFGIVDEITGALVFSLTEPGEFCWPAQDGATLYQVIRSIHPIFVFLCESGTTEVPCWTDTELPASGLTFYYRVRPIEPYVGSWGVNSSGEEVTGLCGLP